MLLSTISLLLVILVFRLTSFVDAWWDEGHMLVAGVAKLELEEDEVDALEKVLGLYELAYPGMSSIIAASVWADHVKCTSRTPFCQGLPAFDGLEIFDSWHFVNQPYNPEHIDLPGKLVGLPWPSTGAVWALQQLFAGLTGHYNRSSLERPNRHVVSVSSINSSLESYGQTGKARSLGTPLSWNLQLRLLIHIFGDLHQPLHAIEAFSNDMPFGDYGGKKVKLLMDNATRFRDLHGLWDGCSGGCIGDWPTVDQETILERAMQLRSDYPRHVYGARLKGHLDGHDFHAVAGDSFEVAQQYVYQDIFRVSSDGNHSKSHRLFRPSDAYCLQSRNLALGQVTLAGYRLSNILREVARHAQSFVKALVASGQLGSARGMSSTPNAFRFGVGMDQAGQSINSNSQSGKWGWGLILLLSMLLFFWGASATLGVVTAYKHLSRACRGDDPLLQRELGNHVYDDHRENSSTVHSGMQLNSAPPPYAMMA